jgi:hypothetical protein
LNDFPRNKPFFHQSIQSLPHCRGRDAKAFCQIIDASSIPLAEQIHKRGIVTLGCNRGCHEKVLE